MRVFYGLIFANSSLDLNACAMIRILKLQKAIIAFILGVAALVAYKVINEDNPNSGTFLLTLSGLLLIAGAFLFLYPILSAKKIKDEDCVELDPEKQTEL